MDVVQIGCVAHLTLGQKRGKRRWWTHPAISNRLSTRQSHIMFGTHRKISDKCLYYRMSTRSFDELLNLIYDKIVKNDTNMRKLIGPVERLAVTLSHTQTFLIILLNFFSFTYHNFVEQ
jgi:hypothetical protein